MWVIEYYEAADGTCPTKEFLNSLHKEKELPYVIDKIDLLAELGYKLQRPHADILEDGIYELRVRLQHRQFRILYFYFFQDKIIFSHGLKKNDKKVRTAEIEKAKRHKLDYFSKHERRK
jgi:phage-related protein